MQWSVRRDKESRKGSLSLSISPSLFLREVECTAEQTVLQGSECCKQTVLQGSGQRVASTNSTQPSAVNRQT